MVELCPALSHYHKECKAEVSKWSVTRKYVPIYSKGLVEVPFMNLLFSRRISCKVACLTRRSAAAHVSYTSSRRFFFLQLSNSIAFSLEMEKGNSGQLKKIHIVLVLVICDQYYFSFQFLGCNVLFYTDYNVLSWNDVSASVLNYRFKFRQVTKVIG